MKASDFQQLCLRTERQIDSEVEERFEDVAGRVLLLMRQLAGWASEADELKKYIFYGKGNMQPDDLDEDPATVIAAEEDLRVVHGILGLVSEVGELIDVYMDYWQGESEALDVINVVEEVGDLGWYCSVLVDSAGSTLGTAFDACIDKLSERYPDRFSEQSALERNLDKERQALEGRIDGSL